MRYRSLNRVKSLGAVIALTMLTFSAASSARADETKKRDVPEYEGRKGRETSPGEVLLWIPRLVLYPVYLATEYLVRRPIGAIVKASERSGIAQGSSSTPASGRSHFGFAPLALFDLGFQPRVGADLTWHDAFRKGHEVHAIAGFGGIDWFLGSLSDQIPLGPRGSFEVAVSAATRTDLAYFGPGPSSRESNRTRYALNAFDATVGFDLRPRGGVHFRGTSGLRVRGYSDGDYGSDQPVSAAVQRGAYPYPDSFLDGYVGGVSEARLTIDSRARRTQGSGFRVDVRGAQGSAPNPNRSWVGYGGEVTGFLDLTQKGRIVSLSVAGAFADPLTERPVPFSDLVTLGGDGLMNGFVPGRLVGRSAACATLAYRWPVWGALDGFLEAAVGNVLGPHLEDMRASLLRFSGAVGLEARDPGKRSFRLLVGMGSETFANGGNIEAVRFTVGTPHEL